MPQRAQLFSETCAVLRDPWAMVSPTAQGVLWDGVFRQ